LIILSINDIDITALVQLLGKACVVQGDRGMFGLAASLSCMIGAALIPFAVLLVIMGHPEESLIFILGSIASSLVAITFILMEGVDKAKKP
jgi:hypothetical protein